MSMNQRPLTDQASHLYEAALEQRLFGRDEELRHFETLCLAEDNKKRVINVHGTGGVGKTTLLHAFQRIAASHAMPYFLLDSREFPGDPSAFCHFLLRQLQHYSKMPYPSDSTDADELADYCSVAMHQEAVGKRVILAFDTFEVIGELEHWLRDVFMSRMPEGTLMIVAGRFPLAPAWHASPAYIGSLRRIPLTDLDYPAAHAFLQYSGIQGDDIILDLYHRTKGHPLSLTLLASTAEAPTPDGGLTDDELFAHIVQTWLREVSDTPMLELVESAAVARQFNQELLSYLAGTPVSTERFRQLVAYSFIQRTDKGWLLHELLREAIVHDLRTRMPERYNQLWKRSILYYSERLKQSARNKAVAWESAELLYYIGNQFIHFLLYRQWVHYSVEPLSLLNWTEAEHYIQLRRETAKEAHIHYVDPDTGANMSYLLTIDESIQVLNQIRLSELFELDPGCVKLIRNGEGKVYGLLEIIPIQEQTMPYLLDKPLSSSFFSHLTESERQALIENTGRKSGYFIKTLDVFDFSDIAMMHASLSTLINHMLSTGYIVAAPIGNPISSAILLSLGLEQVTGVTHSDYDGHTPTPYYILDTRGAKVHAYLDRMFAMFGLQSADEDKSAAMEALTRREREVVEGVVNGRSNLELAIDLCLSEVTVKKHLANIFRKLNVKSRAQLIRKVSRPNS
ncbi:LuxR C-terminal-related transcriptional regulator [Paenibacillus sp. strain BS8-2]